MSRPLDFTGAVGYDQVDLDSCLLSEKPRLALQEEDSELLPEPHPLPRPVRGIFFHCIRRSPEEIKMGASFHRVEEAE